MEMVSMKRRRKGFETLMKCETWRVNPLKRQ
jgi:hypothetical protein